MADIPNENAAAETPADNVREMLEKQIAALRRDITKINKTLAERAEEAVEEASGWYDTAAEKTSRAAQQVKSQAQSVSRTVKKNPGIVSSAMFLGATVGVMIGLAIGYLNDKDQRWF